MLATLTWWGIGIIGVATTVFAFSFKPLAVWWEEKHPETNFGKIDPEENARESIAGMMCFAFMVIVFFVSWMIAPKSPILIPEFITWVFLFVALVAINPSVRQIISFGAISVIVPIIFALVTVPSFDGMSRTNGTARTTGDSSSSVLVRSKLIEQNAQHTEASGETFLGAGSFTLRSDSDLKIYHVWQERDNEGTLHVNVAQDGEGKDDKGRDRAVIRDDVPQGAEPYIERIPVYETDPLLLEANDGKLCVKNQDNGCHVNAQRLYDKVIIHVPAGSVVPSVNPNLPVDK
jgi:hypothetical protein